LQRNYEIRVT